MIFFRAVLAWVGARVNAKSLIFALYLSAGAIKGNEPSALPIDLTLLLGLFLIIIGGFALVRMRGQVPSALQWILLLFAFLAWGVVYARNTEYGVDKLSRLFTLTFLAMTVPVVAFRTKEDLNKLINSLIITAFLIALFGLSSLNSSEAVYRMTAGSANTVTTGMLAGVATIGVLVWGLEGKTWRFLLSLGMMGIMSLALLAAGSKGPLVALGLTVILLTFGFYRRRPAAVRRLSVTLAVVIVAAVLAWQMLPPWSTDRLAKFFTGDFTQTLSGGRTEHYTSSLALIRNNPQGIGWGGYAVESGVGGFRWYPHNFILEITMEAGWGAGICILILVAVAIYRIARIAWITKDEQAKMLLALLVYFVTAALFSGDINDHRWMFAIMSIALASKTIFNNKHEEEPCSEIVLDSGNQDTVIT